MPCYSPLKGWKDEETGGIKFRPDDSREEMEVACGQCLGCRLDRSRMWAMRIVHESSLYETTGGNCFVTLTYRDKHECDDAQLDGRFHIPDDWSLDKTHWQLFMKRLRKAFAPQKVRFYMCGEYGNRCKHRIDLDRVVCPLCNVGRPHYHACLFNCSFPDMVAYSSGVDGSPRYTSPFLESIWKYGFVDVAPLTYDTAAYVARYCLKKVNGAMADDYYMSYDLDGVVTFLTPEFALMSRGHTCKLHRGMPYQADCEKCSRGIGRAWYDQYKSDLFPSDEIPVPGAGVFRGMPRYYDELFKVQEPLTMEEIKAVRKKFRLAHGDEYTPERLMSKYKVAKARTSLLVRSL